MEKNAENIRRVWDYSLTHADVILDNLGLSRYAVPLLVTIVII